jgi:hypothetical protein
MNEFETKSKYHIGPERKLLLAAVVAAMLGSLGFLISGHSPEGYLFAHVGGLGIMGLSGSMSGYLAKKKGYGFGKAYFWGFAFPAIIGIVAVVVVHLTGGSGCGGIISLAVALTVVAVYALLKSKKVDGKPA